MLLLLVQGTCFEIHYSKPYDIMEENAADQNILVTSDQLLVSSLALQHLGITAFPMENTKPNRIMHVH